MSQHELTREGLRIRDLLIKASGYTDSEIEELRELAMEAGSLPGEDWIRGAQFKVAIELIAAIRQFDRASAKMVTKGNTINAWVLAFAILAALLGGASLWISWLSYQLTSSLASFARESAPLPTKPFLGWQPFKII